MNNVHVLNHPLIQHKLTLMRDKTTSVVSFRNLLNEIGALMTYEICRDLPMESVAIETPMEAMQGQRIAGRKAVLLSILRAGTGMLDGMLSVMPTMRVGHIGLYRDHETLEAVEYYFKVPSDLEQRDVIVVDPMLATGHTAVAALSRLKARQPRSIKFACLVSCPEGIATFQNTHPEVPIYTASVDRQLNDKGYIMPGLGDAGDRIFGTM
jgi:uracil phosphoribosyltransferase